MEERLRRAMRERVEEYLAGVELLLGGPVPAASWAVLRARLRPLVVGWRLLLDAHDPEAKDGCGRCAPERRWGRRHRGEPCSVWRTANAVLVAGFPEV